MERNLKSVFLSSLLLLVSCGGCYSAGVSPEPAKDFGAIFQVFNFTHAEDKLKDAILTVEKELQSDRCLKIIENKLSPQIDNLREKIFRPVIFITGDSFFFAPQGEDYRQVPYPEMGLSNNVCSPRDNYTNLPISVLIFSSQKQLEHIILHEFIHWYSCYFKGEDYDWKNKEKKYSEEILAEEITNLCLGDIK